LLNMLRLVAGLQASEEKALGVLAMPHCGNRVRNRQTSGIDEIACGLSTGRLAK
jgi:hypothetical protein